MIGGRLIEGHSQKLFEGDSVVDLGLQLRVRVNTKPFLEEETFQKEQRRIGFISFVTFADGIISDKDAVNAGPIDNGIDLLHSLDGAVAIKRVKKSDVSRGEIGIDFLEAHSSSRRVYLQELWRKN